MCIVVESADLVITLLLSVTIVARSPTGYRVPSAINWGTSIEFAGRSRVTGLLATDRS